MFPICGVKKNNYGGKFQKWKVEIIWHEGEREKKARLLFEDPWYCERVYKKLRDLPKLE